MLGIMVIVLRNFTNEIFLSSFRTESRYYGSSFEGLASNCKLYMVFSSWLFLLSIVSLTLCCDNCSIMQGIDQLRPNLGVQVQKPNLHTQNQFLLASQQQQILAQAQAQSNLGNSTNYGDMDARRFLPRGSLNAKDGQATRNDGSICSPVLSSSPKVTFLMS